MYVACEELLAELGIKPELVHFEIHIVSPADMQTLNKTYRGKDKPTDVLSFPMLHIKAGQLPSRENFPLDFNPETKKVELGDIVINEDELDKAILARHGLLHLLGYHHDDHEGENFEEGFYGNLNEGERAE